MQSKTKHNYPRYYVDWASGDGVLVEEFVVSTPVKGYNCRTTYICLSNDGTLKLFSGFRWDFGSGPAIDNPAMVYASIAHDAFYDLIKLKKLPRSKVRATVDRFFRDQLLEANVSPFRAWYAWIGVRFGYPLWRAFRGRNGK